MALQFWNTLTRKKEEFPPLPLHPEPVGLYTCGPTVYDFAHIGNFRAYIFEDILKRYLEYRGYVVKHIMNITDIDDKTIKRSAEEGVSLTDYTRRYEKAFFEDRDILRIKPAKEYPRATKYIPEMVEMIKILTEKKYTYQKDGSIYFSIERFPGYGKLSGIDLSSLKKGARVENDEYEKEDVRDFVLWKKSKSGEPSYDTEIGPGRPGWHIECSAMSKQCLGETFDIHTGGVDNIFPHHENEIAQSEAANGKPFARYFLHCAHLLVNNEKMAKSKGNFFTLRDLLDKGYDPIAVRYLLLSVHYRSPLNFTLEGLDAAKNAVERIQGFSRRVRALDDDRAERVDPAIAGRLDQAKKEFQEGLDDDLNMPVSLAAFHNLITELNPAVENGTANRNLTIETINKFDSVLDIINEKFVVSTRIKVTDSIFVTATTTRNLNQEEWELVEEREKAREGKDFARSDAIRKTFEERGIVIEDTPAGPRIY